MGNQTSDLLHFHFDSPPSSHPSSPVAGTKSRSTSPLSWDATTSLFYYKTQELIDTVSEWVQGPYGHYMLHYVVDSNCLQALESLASYEALEQWVRDTNALVEQKIRQYHRTGLPTNPSRYWALETTANSQADDELLLHRYRLFRSVADYYQLVESINRFIPRSQKNISWLRDQRLESIDHSQQVAQCATTIANQYLACMEYKRHSQQRL